jgi:hypothetical protein
MEDDLVPFQVQLQRRQHRRLKQLAERRGTSMGSLVRESVAVYLAETPAGDDPAMEIVGSLNDDAPTPHGDVGIAHDAYLADLHEQEASRRTSGGTRHR